MNDKPATTPANNNGNGMAIHWKILIALVLGAIAGYFSTGVEVLGTPLLSVYDFGGQLFLNALKMLIVPLIASSIALGVAPAYMPQGNGENGWVGVEAGFWGVVVLMALAVTDFGFGLVIGSSATFGLDGLGSLFSTIAAFLVSATVS